MKTVLAILAAAALGGCAATVPPGPTNEQTIEQTKTANTAPSDIGIIEDGINWKASGPANTKAVRVTPEEVTQIGSGPATRQVVYRTDAANFVLSSETDFGIDMVDYNPGDGRLVVKGFRTSASDPTRALAEPLAVWVDGLKALSAEQRAVLETKLKEQAATVREVAPSVASMLTDLAKIVAGVP